MKGMKKLGALLLAMVMVLSMSMPALAATSSTDTQFTITVKGAADGETYTAYKIFDVTYDDDAYSYTIDSASAWYGTVSAATDVFTLTQVSGTTTYIVTVNEEVENEAVIAVFTEAGVPEGAEAAVIEKAANDTVTLDVTDSGAGYYYVTTTLGSLVIIDTTNPDPVIEEKNGIPTVDKWVHENSAADDTWQHEDDADNNQSILFEINISNINGAVNLVLHDSMDSELHIADETDFHLNSIYLYTSENAEPSKLIEATLDDTTGEYVGGDYYLTEGTCTVEGCTLTNCAFEVHFLRDFDDVDATGYISLTYYLVLDEKGDSFNDDYEEIDNYAQVTFGTTSFSEVTQAETYSFGFEVFKYTGEDEEGLSGAEFNLTNESDQTAYFLYEEDLGIYLFEGWGEIPADTDYTSTLVSGSDGMINIEGLDTGTYTLTETKAPDGYNPLTDPITVIIWASYDENTGTCIDHGVLWKTNEDGSFSGLLTDDYDNTSYTDDGTVNVENNTGTVLPGTGGMGTTIFYLIGAILVCGAGVLLITRRRMSREA